MIYYVKGTLVVNDGTNLVIDCNGVAYLMTTTAMSSAEYGPAGSEALAYTYMAVREDAVDLYGFHDPEELEFFKTLISVSGVGGKYAISVLSVMTPEQLAVAILQGDSRSITKAPGVGPKLAQRICLELKDKISRIDIVASHSEGNIQPAIKPGNFDEAVSALIVLGYRRQDAEKAVEKCRPDSDVEGLVREALRYLMK